MNKTKGCLIANFATVPFSVTALPLPIDFPGIEVCLYSQRTLRSGKEKLWFLKTLKDICLQNRAG
ncbi:hypothetical protein AAIO74_25155 (plasmid) [Escherichia coli]|uniref:hypothetical protein n=1 Tax=Escherichia coli TaxID=562 RepID=UPI000F5399A4|nr:hypothetical protein [Escherichia coli]MDQ8086378.1 hypothetical protein [Escherichia coli]QGY22866.1 hypothetical protein F6P93_23660 [Escherichia coli]HCJ9445248.1 hypothetical protein [Escherichia coli]